MTSLREKVGRMLLVGFEGLRAPDYILEWLAEGRIAGLSCSPAMSIPGATGRVGPVAPGGGQASIADLD